MISGQAEITIKYLLKSALLDVNFLNLRWLKHFSEYNRNWPRSDFVNVYREDVLLHLVIHFGSSSCPSANPPLYGNF